MNGLAKVPALAAVFALLWPGVSATVARADDVHRGFRSPSDTRRDSRAGQVSPINRKLSRPSQSGRTKSKSNSGSLWKTVSILAVLVIVIVIGAKLLRKHVPNLGGGIPDDALEVLGKRTIDRGQQITLVRLGSRILIVGSSSGGLQTLGEITDPVEIDYIAGLCRPQTDQASGIAQGFLALFNRNQPAPPAAEMNDEPERFSNGDPVPQPVHEMDANDVARGAARGL